MENIESLIQDLSALSTMQITELRTRLETKWGVSSVVAVSAPQNIQIEAVKEEPTEFGVHLIAFQNKMGVIKMLREITGMGLLQAKEFVEKPLPQEIKTGLSKDDAEEIKRKVTDAGGSVDIHAA